MYRWSVANPFTRWVTQRRARQVFDLMAGFVYSQVLLACVRLQILEKVAQSPRSLQELALMCQVSPHALQRLLQSAVALRLLEWRGPDRYGLGALGAPVAGHPGLRAMIEHHAALYHDMHDPVALLRDQMPQSEMAAYWPYAQDAHQDGARSWQDDKVARYSELMAASQPFVIDEVLAAYNFDAHQQVLDVGGGKGGFVRRLAQHARHLRLNLFDLPQVAAIAQQQIDQNGMGQRIQTHGGDFLRDPLPSGADLVTLIRIAHDHPDADVLTLLKAIHQALPVGGTLLLAEPMAQAPGQQPLGDAYFHFYLLAMGSGRLRTPHELGHMMAQAGFTHIEEVPNAVPLQTQILVGRKSQCFP
jgi:demethylspheroidene O-methyltransferase